MPKESLDPIDTRLLLALSLDGRQSASNLAKELGLSRQAVTERIHELERRGVIRGYQAVVDPASLGLTVGAQIRFALDGAASRDREKELVKRLKAHPMVRSVYRVSGEDCFVVHVVCRRIEDVNALLAEVQATRAVQSSRTSFVLETIVEKGSLGTLDGVLDAGKA